MRLMGRTCNGATEWSNGKLPTGDANRVAGELILNTTKKAAGEVGLSGGKNAFNEYLYALNN